MVVGMENTACRRETAKGGEETLSENRRPVRQAQGRQEGALRERAQINKLQCSLNSGASAADASRWEQ
jgi:hypothetical protein